MGDFLPTFILLTLASFFAQVYELEIVPHYRLSTQISITLAALYIGSLPLALWVVIISTIPAELILRWKTFKHAPTRFFEVVSFNVGQLVLSTAAAALVLSLLADPSPVAGHSYVAMASSFLVYMLANLTLVAGVIALSSEERFLSVMRVGSKRLPLQFITMGVLAILMYTLHQDEPLELLLAFVPLALVHYSMRSYLGLRRDSHLAFKRITDLLEQRDQYTADHSDEVEELSVRLAASLGLRDEELDAIRAGAAIHDIGKIAIPDAILHKQGPLDDEEFEIMKTHTTTGADIISNLDIYRDVVPIVLHEHEHWDGGGYPHGLKGVDIPLGARIVAVADVYSALTTARSYRLSQGRPLQYSPAQAHEIMTEMAGTVLDPSLVTRFFDRVLSLPHDKPGSQTS